jgi:hypothetical protein
MIASAHTSNRPLGEPFYHPDLDVRQEAEGALRQAQSLLVTT